MRQSNARDFVKELFKHHHDARINPRYLQWRSINAPDGKPLAVLGYRGAADGPLYLESYIQQPIERLLEDRLGVALARAQIVEIGCLAATPSAALIRLWLESAKVLGKDFAVAVATLTEPLRKAFARVGLPFSTLAPASRERLRDDDDDWGRYYDQEPWICAGVIADGEDALARYAPRLGGER